MVDIVKRKERWSEERSVGEEASPSYTHRWLDRAVPAVFSSGYGRAT